VTARKREILDIAMNLVVRDGMAALTMKQVAIEVGFSEAAMYRHFDSKQDLIINLIGMIRVKFRAIFDEVDESGTPAVFFSSLLGGMLGYIEKTRGVTMLFFSESTYNRDAPVRDELSEIFKGLIGRISMYLKKCSETGTVRRLLDCDSSAVLFIGIIQSVTIRYILSGGEISMGPLGNQLLDVYLQGITP
jgi:AcrR family transcriptional regulator